MIIETPVAPAKVKKSVALSGVAAGNTALCTIGRTGNDLHYRGYDILASAPFRLTRNSNLCLEEEETRNLLDTIDSQVALRRKGDAVRLEIEATAHHEIVDRLVSTFELD